MGKAHDLTSCKVHDLTSCKVHDLTSCKTHDLCMGKANYLSFIESYKFTNKNIKFPI